MLDNFLKIFLGSIWVSIWVRTKYADKKKKKMLVYVGQLIFLKPLKLVRCRVITGVDSKSWISFESETKQNIILKV